MPKKTNKTTNRFYLNVPAEVPDDKLEVTWDKDASCDYCYEDGAYSVGGDFSICAKCISDLAKITKTK